MKPLDGIGLAVVAAASAVGLALTLPGADAASSLDLDYALAPKLIEDYDFGEQGFEALLEVTEASFGPHAAPTLPEAADLEELGMAPGQLERGRALYLTRCMHCHGANGGGDGVTARYLNPPPRNFRLGVIKFTSTVRAAPPTRSDIANVLRRGVAGTAMPSFINEPAEDIEALVSYVQYLMMRGRTSDLTAYELDDNGDAEDFADGSIDYEELKEAISDYMEEQFEDVYDQWAGAEDEVVLASVPRPPMSEESIERGKEVFLSAATECSACHGNAGEGKGENVYDAETDTYKRQDDWGNPAIPADLTRGFYRGGQRPIDLFRRMHQGIKGTIMPGFDGNLSEEEMWDVVNYVYSVRQGPR